MIYLPSLLISTGFSIETYTRLFEENFASLVPRVECGPAMELVSLVESFARKSLRQKKSSSAEITLLQMGLSYE